MQIQIGVRFTEDITMPLNYLSDYLSDYLSIYLSIYLSNYPFIFLLSIYPSNVYTTNLGRDEIYVVNILQCLFHTLPSNRQKKNREKADDKIKFKKKIAKRQREIQ